MLRILHSSFTTEALKSVIRKGRSANTSRFTNWDTAVLSPTYRSADKSLARPGRKRATATKLLTFASHWKTIWSLSVQPGLRDSSDLRVGRKMANFFNCFFIRVRLRTYQHPCKVSHCDVRRVVKYCVEYQNSLFCVVYMQPEQWISENPSSMTTTKALPSNFTDILIHLGRQRVEKEFQTKPATHANYKILQL